MKPVTWKQNMKRFASGSGKRKKNANGKSAGKNKRSSSLAFLKPVAHAYSLAVAAEETSSRHAANNVTA